MPRPKRPYDDPQWPRVRDRVLERDEYRCRIRGEKCEGKADQADHIVPWEAGGAWFDESNLRGACGACNAGRAARMKHRDGWRRSSTWIVLVVGPPGAGKSTWVRDRAAPSDLVVDYDLLAEALGSQVSHGHESDVARIARGAVLNQLRRGELDAPRAWVVSANPEAELIFPHHEVVVIDPGRGEVLRRCEEAGRPDEWVGLVDDWYRRRPGMEVAPSREW